MHRNMNVKSTRLGLCLMLLAETMLSACEGNGTSAT